MKPRHPSLIAGLATAAILAVSFAGVYPHRHEDPCCDEPAHRAGYTPDDPSGSASLQHVRSYVSHAGCHVCFFKKLTSSSRIESFKRCPVQTRSGVTTITGVAFPTSTGLSFIESRGPPSA